MLNIMLASVNNLDVEKVNICSGTTLKAFQVIGYIIYIIKILVPIIIIVLGMIDFGKAVLGKDEAEIKKAQMMFVKRAIYAVAVFFVITLVNLIMSFVAKYVHDNTDVNAESWIDCFGFTDTISTKEVY